MEAETCKRELVIQIPPEIVRRESENLAHRYARTVRVPGFRPGRAPQDLILRRFRGAIREEVAQTLLPKFFQDAIKEQQLSVVGDPRFEDLKLEDDQPLTCRATFEIYPSIDVGDYKGMEVTEETPQVTDEEVNKVLEQMQEKAATFEVVEDRPAADGDTLTVRYEGWSLKPPRVRIIDSREGIVRLGEEGTVAGFRENLTGVHAGEVREFDVEYRNDFPDPKLAGKTIHFVVEVQAVKRKVVPELDDDLAKTVSGAATFDELKNEVRKNLEESHRHEAEVAAKRKLVDALIDRVKFPVPEALREDRLDEKLRSLAIQLVDQGIDLERAEMNWPKLRTDMRPEVEREVRGMLILQKIADAEGLEVTEEEIDEAVCELAAGSNETPAALKTRLTQQGRLARLQSSRRNQKALDFLYRNAKVVHQPGPV